MVEPIYDESYWKDRLTDAVRRSELHRAVFHCTAEEWRKVEFANRIALKKHISDGDAVLDAGCGYGALLEVMPIGWRGRYVGVDLSEPLLALARTKYPKRKFVKADLRTLPLPDKAFDVAVLRSIKAMVIRNSGGEDWDIMEAELRRVAHRILVLEYDPHDRGTLL